MASTYTTSLQIQKIGNGEQSGVWGTTTNTNWDLIEQAVAGVQNITMSNADYTLTVVNGASDEARNAVLVVAGTNSAIRKIVIPAVTKVYLVVNSTSGGYAITIGTSGGAVATIPSGVSTLVYCDGTNTYNGININSISGAFSATGNITSGGTYYATQTVSSVSVGSPGVVTLATTASGLVNNTPVYFSLATGATLPTGLTAGTTYYVTNLAVGASTTFNLAASIGGAAINTTGSVSSGSVSLVSAPYLAVTATTANYINAVGSITTNGRFYPGVLTDANTSIEKVSSVASISVNPSIGSLNAAQFTNSQAATFTIGTSLVTVGTAVNNGQQVFFEGSSGATFPTGITAGTTYYVVNATGVTFQLAATSGGTAITMSGSQSGTFVAYFPIGGSNAALTAGTGITGTSATYNGSSAVTFNSTGSTINTQTTGYTLVASDAGKTISITTGGVSIPASILAAGNIVTIYNNSGSNQTITQGTGLTLQWAGQASTGNRTLGQYGMVTVTFISPTTAVITGVGLS